MSFLFFLIISISIFLLIFPALFKLVFVYLLGFSKAQIKLKHPFKFVRTNLELHQPIWGIELITIFIPEIKIALDVRAYKIRVTIDRPRVMLTRSNNQLLSLKIVDGIKQNNLLYNLVTILKSLKNGKKRNNQKQNNILDQKSNKIQNKFGLGLKAALQFILLFIVQLVQVKIINGDAGIVSSITKQQLQKYKDPRIQIVLLQSFAQYLFVMRELNIGVNLINDHEINIQFKCPFLKLYTAQHMEDVLIKSQNLAISVRIPFTFSLKRSMEKIGVFITIPKLHSYSTPVDFQNLSKIMNQMLFEQQIFDQNYIPKQKNQQKPQDINQLPHNKLVLSIDQVQIKISQLAQQDQDTPQAYKYLSNILTGILKFQKVKLSDMGFMVNEVSLSVKKYDKLKQQFLFHIQNQKSYSKQVLKINNLLITKQDNTTRISHDDVKISCQRQELALLGKLFILINSRVIIDQYDQIMYLPYLEIVRNYTFSNKSLQQCIKQILQIKNHSSSLQLKSKKSQINKQTLQHESSVIYNPKQIQLQLDISQLIHKIILYSSQYRQSRILNGQINHELTFKKITMQYRTTKQFQVSDFKLFYKQTEATNQLELQVFDIHMIQNFYTLKDYFVGFTMFKLLLQFTSDQYQKQTTVAKKSVKTRKKSLNFGKIVINYATQMLTLRKLSVTKQTSSDNKQSSLYFSLAKCDFSVQRLYQTNKIMKYNLNPSHDLLSITSITVKQFLTSSSNTNSNSNSNSNPSTNPNINPNINLKQKYMISIKNPIFLLPQIDISDRLLNYVKTFNKLQPSLQVFMNNTTDQKIRAKRRKYKIFMIDTDIFMIKINNLLIGIEDSVFDRSMLNRMRFYREYLQRKPKYNQSQTINYLRQTAQKLNLFEIHLQNISIDIKPLQQAGSNQKSVKQWISSIKQMYMQTQMKQQQQTPRLIKVNNYCLEVDINNFHTKIRDYPFDIINISKIKGSLQYLKTKNIYEQTFHYIKVGVKIDQVSVQVGLSLLSGLGEVYKKLSKYSKSMDQYKNTQQFLHTLKTKSSLQLSSFKPYWHIMHKSADWYFDINKQSQISVKLLTGLTPYSNENLNLKLGPLYFKSNPNTTQFAIQFIQLTSNKLKIFQIGCMKLNLQTIYNQPDLNLALNICIESHNNTKNKKLKDNNIRISQSIIQQLWKIKQLRTDWLLIYGLVDPSSKRQQNVLKRQQQSSYIQLFRIAANMQLKNRDRQLSIFSVLKQVKVVIHIDKFCLQLADQQNEVDLIINNFGFILTTFTKQEKWKMRHFILSLDHIIGRLKMYRKKVLAHYDSNYHFLKLFTQITDQNIIQRQKQQREMFKQIFLVCRGLKLKLNQYAIINGQIMYLLKKLQIDSLKVQLTTQLKKILDSLFVNIFESNKQKVTKLTQNKYFKMSATQKLRQTVVLVIRANRKKKNFCQKLKMYVILKNVQVGFKTSKRLLLLTNGKPTCIKYNTSFINQDLYRADPKINFNFGFDDVEIWVSTHPNHLWVLGKTYSPSILQQAQRILKCSGISFNLQKHQNQILPPHYMQIIKNHLIERYTNLHLKIFEGNIWLSRANIEVLKQIRQILISIVNTKQQKRKEWYNQKQKYSQMITNGREALKSKLSWKYSDITKGSAPILQSKVFVTLDKINITLLGTRDTQVSIDSKQQKDKRSNKLSNKIQKQKFPFMNLISSDIQIKIEIYSQENLKKQFRINNLTIINCLEPEDSSYRVLFEMDHSNNLAILIKVEQCLLTATNHKIAWNFFKLIHINLYPIKLKMTEQLYNQIYYYFFGIKPQTDQSQQQLSNILPDYYLSVLFDEIKVQAWHRTPSRLKRLEGVNVKLQKFQLSNQFLDNKTLFDRWVKFLMKQMASQFFNVIGQKLFG